MARAGAADGSAGGTSVTRGFLAWFCWSLATSAFADDAALPAGLATERDLRGIYRAALCGRADLAPDMCARALRKYSGEATASAPRATDPARYRLMFVPGFLASCFPGIHSFADVVETARKEGFAAEVLAVGGRNGITANARLIAEQIDRLPADGRRLVLVGHSKGAADLLEMLALRPDIATRVTGLLTVGGALQGSPLADDLYGAYGMTLGLYPFSGCARGDGDPVSDLMPDTRREWWARVGPQLRTPVYSLVSLPDLDRLSMSLTLPYARLAILSPDNDGMLLVKDQVAPGGQLLGVVNADHLTVGIPFPGAAWVLLFSAAPFPRPQVILAAVDVMAARE